MSSARVRGIAVRFLILLVILGYTAVTRADITIETVPVGNIGNTNDTRYETPGYGRVDYPYLIGKYEITNTQWRGFLTAKASLGDPYGLYNADMAGFSGGIARNGLGTVGNPYVYTAKGGDANWDNRPVNYVSFWDAARFCNWLHNGQGSDGDTENGAYTHIGDQANFARQPGAKYFIPTENEWYKAAYHKNDGVTGNYFTYPTASDTAPINTLLTPDPGNHANFFDYYGTGTGSMTLGDPYYTTLVGDFENSASAYGTFDQGGNVWEWNESKTFSEARGSRGGSFTDLAIGYEFLHASVRRGWGPTEEQPHFGFRVASVPEPGSIVLILVGATGWRMWRLRRKG